MLLEPLSLRRGTFPDPSEVLIPDRAGQDAKIALVQLHLHGETLGAMDLVGDRTFGGVHQACLILSDCTGTSKSESCGAFRTAGSGVYSRRESCSVKGSCTTLGRFARPQGAARPAGLPGRPPSRSERPGRARWGREGVVPSRVLHGTFTALGQDSGWL